MLPVGVIANPQILSVETIGVAVSFTRNYQRSYIDINRHAFGLWMKSLVPISIKIYYDSPCRKIWREDDEQHVIFRADGWEQHIIVRYPVGADGANSVVRWHLCSDHQVCKYVATQQQFTEKHPVPFYSCIFNNLITNYYSWSTSRDGYFIFGGACLIKDGQTRFTTLKGKTSAFQFQFGKAVKNEKCTALFPLH